MMTARGAAGGRLLSKTIQRLVAQAHHTGRGKRPGQAEEDALCLLVVPSGMAATRTALTLGLVSLSLIACTAGLVATTLSSREPTLSVRKALALTARPHAEPTAPEIDPAPVPEWVSEHFAEAMQNAPWAEFQAHEASAALPAEAPQVPAAEATAEPATELPFTGVWAANSKACSPQLTREGFLPTIINDQGAWAGETTCAFKSVAGAGKAFVASAVCSDPQKSWRAQVRLTVDGRRLTWKSQSGTRTYVRCDQSQPRTHVAQAGSR